MKRMIVCCLLLFFNMLPMEHGLDADVRFYVIPPPHISKEAVAILEPRAALQCKAMQSALEQLPNSPALDFGYVGVYVPEQFSSFKLWDRLKQCLENPIEVEQVKTQDELRELFCAADYLGNEILVDWCANEWAERDYEGDPGLFVQLEGMVADHILRKQGLTNLMLASTVENSEVRLKDFPIKKNPASVWVCALGTDGSAAAGRADGTIHYWIKQPNGWQRKKLLNAHDGEHIGFVQFYENNTKLISSAWGKGVKIWDIETGNCCTSFGEKSCNGFFFAFDQKRQLLAVSSKDDGINIYDLKQFTFDGSVNVDDRPIEPIMQLEGHNGRIYALDMCPLKNLLLSIGKDRRLALWDLADGHLCCEFELPNNPFSARFNHSGDYGVVGLIDGMVQIIDLRTEQVIVDHHAHNDGIWSCYFSKDDSLLFTGSLDKKIKIWAFPTMDCLKEISDDIGRILYMDHCEALNQLLVGFGNGKMKMVDISKILQAISSAKTELKYGMTIAQAKFFVQAAQSTKENPLECNGEIGTIFNSFLPGMKKALLKNFYLKTIKTPFGSYEELPLEVPSSDSDSEKYMDL